MQGLGWQGKYSSHVGPPHTASHSHLQILYNETVRSARVTQCRINHYATTVSRVVLFG